MDLREWETAVRAYEDQAMTGLDPVVKCATLLRHAPPEVRHVLLLSADRLGDDYRAMRDCALTFVRFGLDYSVLGVRRPGPDDSPPWTSGR